MVTKAKAVGKLVSTGKKLVGTRQMRDFGAEIDSSDIINVELKPDSQQVKLPHLMKKPTFEDSK